MKNSYKIIATLIIVSAFGINAKAQDDINDLIKGSQADAQYLVGGYIAPFLKTYASGINQGWFNTAKPHKIGGFDFTVSIAAVGLQSSDKNFVVDNNRLNEISLVLTDKDNPNSGPVNGIGSVPTAFGEPKTPQYQIDDTGELIDGPPGIEGFDDIMKNRVPVPVFNAAIGLPKGTELKIRWTPEISFGDGDLKLIGFGVMHDVKQYIPGIKLLPFDLSAMVAYTRMTIGVDFDKALGQRGEFVVQGTTIQAMISKKISVITPYASLGYNIGSASLKAKGAYDVDDDGITDITDPLSVEEKASGPRITTGLRLKLAIFTFHADYTVQKYSTFTAGFGLSVR